MGQDFDASWRTVGPQLLTLAVAAQLGSVRQGLDYTPAVLSETDQPDDPAGQIRPSSLVGVASDGRDLKGLLYSAVTQAKLASGQGMGTLDALARGGRQLDMITETLVTDAARDAVGLSLAIRPQIHGYVRMLNTPSCSRCVILAGKFFKWNQGFQRHPRCDCRHIPSSEQAAGDFRTDPELAYQRGQVRGLSRADKQAIDDGADLGQVVNARRGMRTVTAYGRQLKVTSEGTTVRGMAGKRLASQGTNRPADSRYRYSTTPRLRPESIYQAAESREQAIELFRRFGYVT